MCARRVNAYSIGMLGTCHSHPKEGAARARERRCGLEEGAGTHVRALSVCSYVKGRVGSRRSRSSRSTRVAEVMMIEASERY